MTPDEKQLIQGFFARLAQQGAPDKDRAADTLILQEFRRNPDAAYLLVQTSLVYEHQMGELEDRIQDLEQQLEASRGAGTEAGSFLGGRLGQGRSVAQETLAGLARSRPSNDAPSGMGRASPWSQQPVPVPQPAAAAQGGGFFRSAMAAAAGVAGGMMIGDGLRGLFGGGQNDAAGQNAALSDADRTQDQLQDELAARDAQLAALNAEDDAAQDADFGDDGGSMDV
jgi:uncharacterized protein